GFSHYKRREWAFHWDVASRWATAVMSELLEEELRAGEYWNVNFPHLAPEEDNLPTRVHCPPSRKPLPLQYTVEPGANGLWDFRYSGVYANREHEDGSDVDHCFG